MRAGRGVISEETTTLKSCSQSSSSSRAVAPTSGLYCRPQRRTRYRPASSRSGPAGVVRAWHPDLVVLSGLMRLVPPAVVDAFAPNLINTHPAYLPEFPGAHAVRD